MHPFHALRAGINWAGYTYRKNDGYGRYSAHMVRALRRAGAQVTPLLAAHADMPDDLARLAGLDWSRLTITCAPPYLLNRIPGDAPHWLYSMTEGTELPHGWADVIAESGVERVLVPCESNAETFRAALAKVGCTLPVGVVPGGTDPDEFPFTPRTPGNPYTFLTIADRGGRKGWSETYMAFYEAFGTAKDTPNVRLIAKCLPHGNNIIDLIAESGVEQIDPRIRFWRESVANPADIYAAADCVVMPSRMEGWGMPHREAAMMGLPVITQVVGGLDDGYTHHWAYTVEGGQWEHIPGSFKHMQGDWLRCDVTALAAMMRRMYDNPHDGVRKGAKAAQWLRQHQTWRHSAEQLLGVVEGLSYVSF